MGPDEQNLHFNELRQKDIHNLVLLRGLPCLEGKHKLFVRKELKTVKKHLLELLNILKSLLTRILSHIWSFRVQSRVPSKPGDPKKCLKWYKWWSQVLPVGREQMMHQNISFKFFNDTKFIKSRGHWRSNKGQNAIFSLKGFKLWEMWPLLSTYNLWALNIRGNVAWYQNTCCKTIFLFYATHLG